MRNVDEEALLGGRGALFCGCEEIERLKRGIVEGLGARVDVERERGKPVAGGRRMGGWGDYRGKRRQFVLPLLLCRVQYG